MCGSSVRVNQKAQAGAKLLYEFLNERLGEHSGSTGTGGAERHSGKPSQNTLTPADLAPAWRGPQPRKDAEVKRPA